MFKDPRAAILHAGIFWGFILLTIGTANVVTGGLIQAVLSARSTASSGQLISAMQNVVAVTVVVFILWAFERRFISPAAASRRYNFDALLILG